MHAPSPSAEEVLAGRLAEVRAAADGLAPPPPVPGWASAAALEYEALAARIALRVLRLRAALDEALAVVAQ